MVVKSAMLVKSPFDSSYINVPDKQLNDGEIIYTLIEYFKTKCEYKILSLGNFPNGYSLPLNRNINFTYKSDLYDFDIREYNYLIISDIENAFSVAGDVENYCCYFIDDIRINNSKVGEKSVTNECTLDLWVRYFEDIMTNDREQKIIRSHYYPFATNGEINDGFYTLDDLNQFAYGQQLLPQTNEYEVLYLKILLDSSKKYKRKNVDNAYTNVDLKQEIERGQFSVCLVPYALYRKDGTLVTNCYYYTDVNAHTDVKHFMLFNNKLESINFPYVVGAYLTFAPSIGFDYEEGSRTIYFNNPIGQLVIEGGGGDLDENEIFETGLYPIMKDDYDEKYKVYDRTSLNIPNYYNTSDYRLPFNSFNRIDFNSEDFFKLVPEYHITSKVPRLRCGDLNKRLVGTGKPSVYIYTFDNQSGAVVSPLIKFNGKTLVNDTTNKFQIEQNGYLPITVDQYTEYMVSHANSYNFKLLMNKFDRWAALSRFVGNVADIVSGTQATDMHDLGTYVSSPVGQIFNKGVTSWFEYNRQIQETYYLEHGYLYDMQNAIANMSTTTSSGISDFLYLDRPFMMLDTIIINEDYKKYLVDCHMYGTNLPKIGKVSHNVRCGYDFVSVLNFEIFIPNFNDKNAIVHMLERGVRKIHIDEYPYSEIYLDIENTNFAGGY